MSLPKNETKEGIIATAKDNPLVSYFCHKNSISRATYYRWFKADKKFSQEVRKAQKIGRQAICDLAESKIVNLIKSSNENVALSAAKFILTNNHPYYRQTNSFTKEIRELKEKLYKDLKIDDDQNNKALDAIQEIIKAGQTAHAHNEQAAVIKPKDN